MRPVAAVTLALALAASPRVALGQTCEGNPVYDGCIAAIGRAGGPTAIIRDIFRTTDGRDARSLTFARFLRGYVPSVGETTNPVEYTAYTVMSVTMPTEPGAYLDALDFRWGQHLRQFDDGTGVPDGVGPGMSMAGHDCDGADNCGYAPWRAMIFDLRGDSNRVAVFPVTDHTTDSCLEAFEYAVYLTNNPDSQELAPAGRVDSTRWNRAVLVRAFTEGWTRGGDDPAMMSPRGNYLADSPTLVWSLPCGVTFRYASLVAGNYGSPGVECRFNSSDNELDAVAGLNEDGTAVCPDSDGDGFRDRACGGNDCDDRDRAVNPGAVETCASARDLDCDGRVAACPDGTSCFNGLCAAGCVEGACATGFTCVTADGGAGSFCLPAPCASSTCPAGQVCGPRGCQDPCDGARCPTGQVCRGGACVDPCAGVLCPTRQHCEAGRCAANCPCIPCSAGATCNERSGRCEAAGCGALMCPPEALINCTGDTPRCVTPCADVTCPLGSRCDAILGRCVVDRCAGISCPGDGVCRDGRCVRPSRPDAAAPLDASEPTDGARPPADAPAPPRDAGFDAGPDADLLVGETPGCGCHTPPRAARGALGWAALALLAARRRRRLHG